MREKRASEFRFFLKIQSSILLLQYILDQKANKDASEASISQIRNANSRFDEFFFSRFFMILELRAEHVRERFFTL